MNDALSALAEHVGVLTSYRNFRQETVEVSEEALLAVLRSLGCPIGSAADAPDALRGMRAAALSRFVEPCAVVWDGGAVELALRVAVGAQRYAAELVLADGDARHASGLIVDLPLIDSVEHDGVRYERRRLRIADSAPLGYHRVIVDVDSEPSECHVIAAPSQSWAPASARPQWGVFAPLYALRSQRASRFGGPDFTDLGQLIAWLQQRGGGTVGTLPLLAGYFEQPCEPSPYAPVTARLWNELYVDLEAAPELAASARARELLNAESFGRASADIAERQPIDYAAWYAHRRPVLAALAAQAFATDGARRDALELFGADPLVDDYARFRAMAAAHGANWRAWPDAASDGTIEAGAVDLDAYRFHVYAQFVCDEQLRARAGAASANGAGLYLDLPVGVHADGYDAWREREVFATGLSVGAPPDDLFIGGQDWGVPAVDPSASRATGHRYLAECIRAHMRFAGVLRVDHVMGLYRRYLVPHGCGARDGVYLRYPEQELFAILCLESHQHECVVVGEDLGTVPDEVRHAMERHQLRRMFVGQFELEPWRGDRWFPPAPQGCVASFNTHDMPPFAAFWRGIDIDDRRDLGLIDEQQANDEHWGRGELRASLGDDERAALERILGELAASDAWLMLASLEDLWLETRQQNTPGTSTERPNWRYRMRHRLEELSELPDVARALDSIAAGRGSR